MAYQIEVNLTARTLILTQDGQVVRQYPVGIGKPSTPSPEGHYVIAEKQVVSDPNFGTRWMGLNNNGYGIHGAYNDASVGRAMSHGCIRMHVADAEDLYDLVPIGTPVYLHR
ncbi:MAG: L,D-transpeptidase [Symbiobacteriia bacterium]